MLQIWKFMLNPDQIGMFMPKGAKILTIQTQQNTPCIWALVNPLAEKVYRTFKVFGTGHEIPEELLQDHIYIGTFQLDDGNYVFHLFEQS